MSLELDMNNEMEEIEYPIDYMHQCFDVNLILDAFHDTNFWLPDASKDNDQERVSESIEHKPNPAPSNAYTITTLVNGPTSRNEMQTTLHMEMPTVCTFQDINLHSLQLEGVQTPCFASRNEDTVSQGRSNAFHYLEASPALNPIPMVGTEQAMTNTSASVTQSHQKNRKGKPKCIRKKVNAKHNTKIATRPIVKALTPYNFFFRFERSRLLKCIDAIEDPSVISHLRDNDLINYLHEHLLPSDYNDHYHWTVENSTEEQRKILEEQWGRDTSVKLVHAIEGIVVVCL